MTETYPAADHARRVLVWYDRHRRTLPWRAARGETPDPYRVWLSEIMLQQTTVATVRGYFQRFIERWPSLPQLAAAPIEDVLSAWAGLGYYARARNLHRCAAAVMARFDGRFPGSEAELLSLPGIGPYTAAAIAAIAFDLPASAVDGNVERVVARLHALRTPMPDAKPMLRQLAARLVPQRRAGDYAQAMMDLGATVCAPRNPACSSCPVSSSCRGFTQGLAEALPYRRSKPARPQRAALAFVLERHDGAILLRRRPAEGLLGGMLELPSSPWQTDGPTTAAILANHAPKGVNWQILPGAVKHVFTHFELTLTVAVGRLPARKSAADRWAGSWHQPREFAALALPTVMRKVLAHWQQTPSSGPDSPAPAVQDARVAVRRAARTAKAPDRSRTQRRRN